MKRKTSGWQRRKLAPLVPSTASTSTSGSFAPGNVGTPSSLETFGRDLAMMGAGYVTDTVRAEGPERLLPQTVMPG
jgi:hypothetical protein